MYIGKYVVRQDRILGTGSNQYWKCDSSAFFWNIIDYKPSNLHVLRFFLQIMCTFLHLVENFSYFDVEIRLSNRYNERFVTYAYIETRMINERVPLKKCFFQICIEEF